MTIWQHFVLFGLAALVELRHAALYGADVLPHSVTSPLFFQLGQISQLLLIALLLMWVRGAGDIVFWTSYLALCLIVEVIGPARSDVTNIWVMIVTAACVAMLEFRFWRSRSGALSRSN